MSTRRRVAVIGGGIAGLATAFRIRHGAAQRGLEVDVTVLEREAKPGGKIGTVTDQGFAVEIGPTGFLDNEPATLRLVKDLGMQSHLLRSNDAARNRYILRRGRFHKLEMNPILFMRSPLLSPRGRFRLVAERFVPPKRDDREETAAQFGRRRLGQEFVDVMLDSMVSGIFAGDVNQLSIEAAFPKIPEMERRYGGLIKALMTKRRELREAKARARKTGQVERPREVTAGPGGVLHSFTNGLGEIIDTLATQLGHRVVHTGVEVRGLHTYGANRGYRLDLGDRTLDVDAVVLALPAHVNRELLRGFADDAAVALGEIPFAGVHVVATGYERKQVDHPLRGFGALIPRMEGLRILGTIWTSSTFAGRAPEGHVLLTTMVGGAHDPAANDLGKDELLATVLQEIEPFYRIDGQPGFVKMFRWPVGIPQYNLGHLEHVAAARKALAEHPGVFLTGNSVAGVSMNHCVAHSEKISEEVLEFLSGHASHPVHVPDHGEARA
jgi:oxygen-dependent protoporphyrinogen oxidase